MKKILIAFGVLAVGACTTIPSAINLATNPVCTGYTADEKAWYAAEAAYNVPAQAYLAANSHGLLTPALKATLKPKLQTAYLVVKAARTAYLACDAASLHDKITTLLQLKAEVLALVPKAN